jgi:hypothetical protein
VNSSLRNKIIPEGNVMMQEETTSEWVTTWENRG